MDTSQTRGFDDDAGWVALPNFLSSAEVERTNHVCRELLSLPAPERRPRDKPHAGTRHLAELDHRSALVSEIVNRRRLVEAVAGHLGSEFTRVQVEYRSPQPSFGGQRLHADDVPKLTSGPATVATAIVALTEFTARNGATRVVAGSHRRPDLQRQSGSMETHPDETFLTGPAGTAFVFSGHLLHSGTTNRSQSERPALQVVWRR